MEENECNHYFYLKEGEPNTVKCIFCGQEEPAEENDFSVNTRNDIKK